MKLIHAGLVMSLAIGLGAANVIRAVETVGSQTQARPDGID